jgi:hypothetical protein
LAAPAIGHLIGTTGLIVLIFIMPLFYGNVADGIEIEIIERELKEIVDYTSNTIENLYFLVNSTEAQTISLEKELVYLPSSVEGESYILSIVGNGTVTHISANLKDRPSVEVYSWFIPGLTIIEEFRTIESGEQSVVVGCSRNQTGIFVWIRDV